VLTFGDVRRYLYSHGSREPKHPNKSFIKNLVVSKLLLTFVKHISHRCMFERIYVCGFFFEKSLIGFWILKIKYYLCTRITNHTKIIIRETDSDIRSVVNHPDETDESNSKKKC